MKNDETTCYYESVFAVHMAGFIRYNSNPAYLQP
jgi:hypothetical protein